MGQKQSISASPASTIKDKNDNQTASSTLSNTNTTIIPDNRNRKITTDDDKRNKSASKLSTDCRKEQRASLACIEENYTNKNEACAVHFETYKACRRKEHERKLEANARASAW